MVILEGPPGIYRFQRVSSQFLLDAQPPLLFLEEGNIVFSIPQPNFKLRNSYAATFVEPKA